MTPKDEALGERVREQPGEEEGTFLLIIPDIPYVSFTFIQGKASCFLNGNTCNVSGGSHIKWKPYSPRCFSQGILVPCHSDWPLLGSPSN